MAIKLKKLSKVTKNTLTTLYGDPGSGKTRFSSTLPGTKLLIDTDHGTGSIPEDTDIEIAECDTFDDVVEAIDTYAKDFDSIIIDHMTNVQKLCYDKLLDDKKKDRMTIELYGLASSAMKDVIFKAIQLSMSGKNVIMLVQKKTIDEVVDGVPTGNVQVSPDLQSSVANYILSTSRIVAMTKKQYKIKKVDGKPQKVESFSVVCSGMPNCILKYTTNKGDVPSEITKPTWKKLIKHLS